MFESFAESFCGIVVIAAAVLAAYSVRPRWRLALVLGGLGVAALWSGLRGDAFWQVPFRPGWFGYGVAGLLAIGGSRFRLMFPAVLILWWGGGGAASSFSSLADAFRGLHGLLTLAFAGIGLGCFLRLFSWTAGDETKDPDERPHRNARDAGWAMVSSTTACLLILLMCVVAYELTFRSEVWGLTPPLGLLTALAESIAGLCLWRATVQAKSLDDARSSAADDASPAGWPTIAGLMVVFLLTGLAFATVPLILLSV